MAKAQAATRRSSRGTSRGKAAARRRAVVVHGMDHARAALCAATEMDVAVRLLSAPGAAAFAGALWFERLIAEARREFPDAECDAALDCGDSAGLALGALRQGLPLIRFHGPKAVTGRVAAIARRQGAALDAGRGAALDLAQTDDPLTACRGWLGKGQA